MPVIYKTALADALARAGYNAKLDMDPTPPLPVETRAKRFKIIPASTSVSAADWSPEYREGRFNHIMGKRTNLVREAVKHSRFVQGFEVQANNFEKHVNLQKPVNHRYPAPILAHDRALDWHRPEVDVNLQQRIKADSELRAKIQNLANEGAFDEDDFR